VGFGRAASSACRIEEGRTQLGASVSLQGAGDVIPQVLLFLAVVCFGLAPERATLLAVKAVILMFAVGLT
jgi:hypothetical protein